MKREKQTLGKQMFARQRRWDTERNFNKQALLDSSHSTNLGHATVIMVIAPFLEQVLYLHSCRQLGGRSKVPPDSLGP